MATVEQVQDRALGNFQQALRTTITEDIVTRAIVDGKQATNERNRRQSILKEKGNCVGNLTPEQLADAKACVARKEQRRQKLIVQQNENRDRHVVLNNALDMFPADFFLQDEIDAESLEHIHGQSGFIADDESIVVDLRLDKSLSSSFRCFMDITYQKPIWVKGPNFDVDKTTIRSTREIKETIRFTAPYGCVLEFRRALLKPIGDVVKAYNIADTTDETTKIWDI